MPERRVRLDLSEHQLLRLYYLCQSRAGYADITGAIEVKMDRLVGKRNQRKAERLRAAQLDEEWQYPGSA